MTREEWQELKIRFERLEAGWPTLLVLLFDLILFGSAIRLAVAGGWRIFFAIPLLTLFLLHSYLLLHEATHSAVSKNRLFNDAVGHLCGWVVLMPFLPRQRSHLLHHMWTGHPVGDPANERIIRGFSVMTEEQATRLERIWRSWFPMLTINDRKGLWKDPFAQRARGGKSRRFVQEIRSAYFYAAGYAAAVAVLAYAGLLFPFLLAYAPAFFFLLVLEELTNLPHHAETPLLSEKDRALPYWEQDRVTHSCRSVPFVSRFLLLNFNQHVAHHFFPWIPWHGLPEVSREIPQEGPRTRSELAWSLTNRKRPLLQIMGHYFDKIPRAQRGAITTETTF